MVSTVALSAYLAAAHGDQGKAITVTEKANGTTVKLKKGCILAVQLAGNPTTGFTWLIDKNNKTVLAPVGKTEYLRDPAPEGIVGRGGKYTFQFKAAKSGTSELKLVYKRPWEKDKRPAETFSLKVVIE
jgi:inhibitor of cysteine peptidase